MDHYHVKLQHGQVILSYVVILITYVVLRSTPTPDEPNDDWINMPDVTESNETQQSTTTTPPPLQQSTRVSVSPKHYGQENLKGGVL